MTLCTCPERGEPDWNGSHEADCPWRQHSPMSAAKTRILNLVERYAEARAQDQLAGVRDAPLSVHRRHADVIRQTRSSLESEIDALIASTNPTT